jgi:hypothetical protein
MKHAIAIPLLAVFAISVPLLQAKSPKKPRVEEPAFKSPEIVAHIPLNAAATSELFMRRGGKGKLYLYALHSVGEAVSVVDITDAVHPAIVTQISYPAPSGFGSVQTVGQNTAMVEMVEQTAPAAPPPTRTIGLLDLSNPGSPKMALRFAGVSAISRDDSRSLLFIVNNEGLWIVRHYEPPDIGVRAWEAFVAAP